MKEITLRDKLSDIVRQEFMLYSIFERLGVNVLLKELTVNDACEINGVNKNLFLTVVNTFINSNFIPDNSALDFSMKDLVAYLTKSHKAYDISFIPRMRELFLKIRNLDPSSGVKLVNDIYVKTQKKFIKHYKHENTVIFPAIVAISDGDVKDCDEKLVDFISTFDSGVHEVFVDAIEDLLNIFIKYVKPNCKPEIVELLAVLDTFSKDLTHHMLIEDKYLYSRIKSGFNG